MIDAVIERLRLRWRGRRMRLFRHIMAPAPGAHILDIGGTPGLWLHGPGFAHVSLLNRSAEVAKWRPQAEGRFAIVEGDICRVPRAAEGYDLVFSNSVLEHVGSARRQAQFAAAVRACPSYWVQVPAPLFPVEVHCRVPFWWMLPLGIRRRWIRRWRRRGRFFLSRQMAGTRPIGRRRLRALFPDAHILTERWLGLPKSYYVYRRGGTDVQNNCI